MHSAMRIMKRRMMSVKYSSGHLSRISVWMCVNGTTSTTFSPNNKTLRGQMTAILYRYAGEPAVSGASSFSDVKSTAYYANAASWAQKNNILISTVSGSSQFLGDTPISRAEFCAMVYNYAGYKSVDRKTASAAPFSDVKGLSSELLTAINWAYANGIVNLSLIHI